MSELSRQEVIYLVSQKIDELDSFVLPRDSDNLPEFMRGMKQGLYIAREWLTAIIPEENNESVVID